MGNFTSDEWNHLLCLFNIGHFSSAECSEVMSERTKRTRWRKCHSKVKTNDEFDCKGSISAVIYCIRKPGENQIRKSKSSEFASWEVRKNGRPVVCRDTCHERHDPLENAHSSSYSEWDDDKAWSTQEWKADALMDDRTVRTVVCPQRGAHVVRIQILLAQGEWPCAKEAKPILNGCNRRQRRTFGDMCECSCLQHCKHLYSWGRNTQTNGIPSKNTEDLTMKQMFDISEKLVSEQSDEIYGVNELSGKLFMETFIFVWWWTGHQSSAHKSLCIFRFCVVSWKDEREPSIKHSMGRQIGRGSKVHGNTEPWIELMVSQLNSSGISSQDSPRCSSVKKFKSYCWDWVKHQRFLQDGLSSCRCSTTFHGDQKTTRTNASQMLNSFLYLQKDSEQDNGHSSDLDQRKSGILSGQIVHKVNGTKWQKYWWWHSQKADTQSSEPRVHSPEERSKAKVLENCRSTVVPTRKRLQLFFAQLLL